MPRVKKQEIDISKSAKTASDYNTDSIQVLSDIEHIIRRRQMYIGEAIDPRQLLSEIIDNALDEAQAHGSEKTVVTVDTTKNEYTVRDYGWGIPHGMKELPNGEKKEVVEVLCTVSNSGGKFDNNSYVVSSGLHGLGSTITNALSKFFRVRTWRDNEIVEFIAEYGDKKSLRKEKDKTSPRGTEVTFIPGDEYFKSSTIPTEFILDRCRVANALGFKCELFVDGEQLDTDYDIFRLIKEESEDIHKYLDIPEIDITNPNSEMMKVAMRYTSDTTDRYFGYTNLLTNYIGGTHVQCLSKTIIETWKRFMDSHKKLKPDIELRNNDYLVGLRAVCAVFIMEPEFSSQTKEKLVTPKSYFDNLMSEFSKNLYQWLDDNIEISESLIKRFTEYRIAQNKLLARKEISSVIKINNDTTGNNRRCNVNIEKLKDCSSKNVDGTELMITEGDSASGPASRVRNKEKQAVLALRGKILNIANLTPEQAIKSQEVCNITNAVGAGLGAACDVTRSRYEKIIISCDADPDGLQIACLVLSVFVNFMPDIVKAGKVYITNPPLYIWYEGKQLKGTSVLSEVPENAHFKRIKGLGEFEDSQFKYFCMDPETRIEYQVEYPSDLAEFNRILGTSEGKADLLKDLGIIRNYRSGYNPEDFDKVS